MIKVVMVVLAVAAVILFLVFVLAALSVLVGATLAYSIVYLIGRARLAKAMRQPEKAATLAIVTLEAQGVEVHPIRRNIRRYAVPYQILATAACLGTALVINASVDGAYLDTDLPEGPLLAVVLLLLSVLLWRRLNLTNFAAKRFQKALDGVDDVFQSQPFADLQGLTESNAELAIRLAIGFHHAGADISTFLESHSAEVLAAPSVLEERMAGDVEQARRDHQQLQWAWERYGQVEFAYHVTARHVVGTGSRGLLGALDQVFAEFEQAKRRFLPARRWERFSAAVDTCLRELREFKDRARKMRGGAGARDEKKISPYEVLRIPPDASVNDIKAVYRKLSTIYHPDVGLTPDGEEMKRINAAYREIMARRGNPK